MNVANSNNINNNNNNNKMQAPIASWARRVALAELLLQCGFRDYFDYGGRYAWPKERGRQREKMRLVLVKCRSDEWVYKYFEGTTSIRKVRWKRGKR